jgi:N-acetylglucosaminyl-diphospho-decaprenol L-rhamnosyltransferase
VVNLSDSAPSIVDERIAKAWAGTLGPKNQPVHVYMAKGNIGFAGGVNVSIRQSEHDLTWSAVWLLNPDTEPAPDALLAMVNRAWRGGYAVVGSRMVFQSSGRVQLYGGRWRPLIARGFNIGLNSPQDADADPIQIERSMTYVSGASLYATRAFIEAVGLLREDYFLYCEDVDWCLRRKDLRLGYAHGSIVYHDHGSTIGSHRNHKSRSKLSVYLDERNKLLLTKNFYPRIFPIVIATTFVLTSQYLIRGAFHNFFVALSGWLAGIRGEIGPPRFMADTRALK